MKNSQSTLSVFFTPEGKASVFDVYQKLMDKWQVPYEEILIPTSYGKTHVVVSGNIDAPPIVLMHAMFASAASWYKISGMLAESYRVIAIDILGEANKSEPTKPMRSLDDFEKWFTEVVDALNLQSFVLVGNSFGGFISTAMSIRLGHRVKGLVLIGPAATFRGIFSFYLHMFVPKALYMLMPWLPFQKRAVEHGITWARAGVYTDELWEELFRRVMLYGTNTNQLFPRTFKREEFARITCPVLLILGDHERIYPAESAAKQAQRLLPEIRVVIVKNANHMAALSQPEVVGRMIASFVELETIDADIG